MIRTLFQSDRFYSALVRGLSNYFDIVQVALSNHSNMTQQAKYKILSDIRKFKDQRSSLEIKDQCSERNSWSGFTEIHEKLIERAIEMSVLFRLLLNYLKSKIIKIEFAGRTTFSSSRRRKIRTTRFTIITSINGFIVIFSYCTRGWLTEWSLSCANFPFIPSQRRKSESEHEKSEEKIDEKKQKHCENVNEWEYSLPFNLKLTRVDPIFRIFLFIFLMMNMQLGNFACSCYPSSIHFFLKLTVEWYACLLVPWPYLYLFVSLHFP